MDLYIMLPALYVCFVEVTCVSGHFVVILSEPYNSILQNIHNIKGWHIEPFAFLR